MSAGALSDTVVLMGYLSRLSHLAGMTVVLVALCTACGADAAGPDRQLRQTIAEEKIAIEYYLRLAEEALPRVPAASKPALKAAVTRARAALERYETLAREGENRLRVEGTLYVTGVALTMDDASGVGTLDNVLLPFVALGFVATRMMMDAPAGSQDITQAWNEVVDTPSQIQARWQAPRW